MPGGLIFFFGFGGTLVGAGPQGCVVEGVCWVAGPQVSCVWIAGPQVGKGGC